MASYVVLSRDNTNAHNPSWRTVKKRFGINFHWVTMEDVEAYEKDIKMLKLYPVRNDIEYITTLYVRGLVLSTLVRYFYAFRWRFIRIMVQAGFIYKPPNERFSWRSHFFVIPRG